MADLRAPTLSPEPLNTLPIDPNDQKLDDTMDVIMGSAKEIQPSLQAFNELLVSGKAQEMLNRD